ncbi:MULTISPECIES: hypothetical protein [Terrabacteria group]|uniref:hypothetical protein n=1 Tax=Bacillati TaxID=1783272 RepID=UPI001939E556|nr:MULTISPECIES: hypothetical protein [Terrabacteria group]MBW9212492.1 hypothetical protein [Trueperella sp. zg.1013]QRG86752.1 hypothetical protein JOS54_00070 [Bulleidia sp. zg-1006]
MSSIVYVCDEDMVEYHRLSQHKEILFWRIATKRKFSDFHIGDLLFFYAKTHYSSEKKLIGYGHFSEMKRLSLRQMWQEYEEKTGYYSFKSLEQAIHKVARHKIPAKMNCLVLKNVIFFARPIEPEEVGLNLSKSLESFAYIDHQQASATSDLLKIAKEEGINIWSNSIDKQTEEVFTIDAIEQRFLSLSHLYPNVFSEHLQHEQKLLLYKKEHWKLRKDFCYQIESENKIAIKVPIPKISKSRQKNIQIFIGRWVCILTELRQEYPELEIQFEIFGKDEEVKELVKKVY